MRLLRNLLTPTSLLLLGGCAGLPFFERQEPSPCGAEALGRAELDLQHVRYDRETLSARLLVGAVDGPVLLDTRLVENASVEVESLAACDSGHPVEFLVADRLPPPAREEHLLTLRPGYWYGAEVRFPLFDARLDGRQGPECIQGVLALRAPGGGRVGELRFRAGRLESEGAAPDATARLDGASAR